MKRKPSFNISTVSRKRKFEVLAPELEMLFWCLALVFHQKINEEHKNIGRIIWEYGRYERCARGSCTVGTTHLHEEAINRGWRLYRPSGKIAIICGMHQIPRVTQFSRKNYCNSCHIFYNLVKVFSTQYPP